MSEWTAAGCALRLMVSRVGVSQEAGLNHHCSIHQKKSKAADALSEEELEAYLSVSVCWVGCDRCDVLLC